MEREHGLEQFNLRRFGLMAALTAVLAVFGPIANASESVANISYLYQYRAHAGDTLERILRRLGYENLDGPDGALVQARALNTHIPLRPDGTIEPETVITLPIKTYASAGSDDVVSALSAAFHESLKDDSSIRPHEARDQAPAPGAPIAPTPMPTLVSLAEPTPTPIPGPTPAPPSAKAPSLSPEADPSASEGRTRARLEATGESVYLEETDRTSGDVTRLLSPASPGLRATWSYEASLDRSLRIWLDVQSLHFLTAKEATGIDNPTLFNYGIGWSAGAGIADRWFISLDVKVRMELYFNISESGVLDLKQTPTMSLSPALGFWLFKTDPFKASLLLRGTHFDSVGFVEETIKPGYGFTSALQFETDLKRHSVFCGVEYRERRQSSTNFDITQKSLEARIGWSWP